jgi:hypothetical protein
MALHPREIDDARDGLLLLVASRRGVVSGKLTQRVPHDSGRAG